VLTGLAYLRTLDAPFAPLDLTAVILNPVFAEPWPGVRAVLIAAGWHPLTAVTFTLDRFFWGTSSFGFHITNLCLHGLVVGLVFRAIAGPGGDRGLTPARVWAAFVAAVVFAVNPLTAATVTFVAARVEILAAIGAIGAAILVEKAHGKWNRARRVSTGCCVGFAAAANPIAGGLSLANYLYVPAAFLVILVTPRLLTAFSIGRGARTPRRASGRVRA
jgi:hypothetical protein